MKKEYIFKNKKVSEKTRKNVIDLLLNDNTPEKVATAFLKKQAFTTGDKTAYERAFYSTDFCNLAISKDDIVNETWCYIMEGVNNGQVTIGKNENNEKSIVFHDVACIITYAKKDDIVTKKIPFVVYLFEKLSDFFYRQVTKVYSKMGGDSDLYDNDKIVRTFDKYGIAQALTYNNISDIFDNVESDVWEKTLAIMNSGKYASDFLKFIDLSCMGYSMEKISLALSNGVSKYRADTVKKHAIQAYNRACVECGKVTFNENKGKFIDNENYHRTDRNTHLSRYTDTTTTPKNIVKYEVTKPLLTDRQENKYRYDKKGLQNYIDASNTPYKLPHIKATKEQLKAIKNPYKAIH